MVAKNDTALRYQAVIGTSGVVDSLTPQQRSDQMRTVRAQDTRPEIAVRSLLHGLGYRFRLRDTTLVGRPDVVFTRRRKVIFVHGCFWHRHGSDDCRLTRTPKTKLDYWQPKFARNMARDTAVSQELTVLGWEIFIVWECQLTAKSMQMLTDQLKRFLGPVRVARLSSGVAARNDNPRQTSVHDHRRIRSTP